ncbi:unnamed protein product [Rotaria sp. Silwood2]|nr:unnamed protein product [Rotaria sp. Silwood2]
MQTSFSFRWNQEDFLVGKCNFEMGECNELHLCRRFGSCNVKDCRFPHDFTCGNYRPIVEQVHCEDINPIILVRFIRLNTQLSHDSSKASAASSIFSKLPDMASSSVQSKLIQPVFELSKHIHSRPKTGRNKCYRAFGEDNTHPRGVVSFVFNMNYQVDISFPSKSCVHDITIEEIVNFLKQQCLPVKNIFGPKQNEYFKQYTLLFQE